MGDAGPVDEAAATEHHFATVVRGPVLLWEGEIHAGAHLERLVAAYDVLVTYDEPLAHLVLADAAPGGAVGEAVRRYAVELALPHAWVAPGVRPEVLSVMRRHATVHLTGAVPDVPATLLAEHLLRAVRTARGSAAA